MEPNTEHRFALITAEGVETLRKLIGVPIDDSVEPWCYEASRDNIRHYAHGIGDDNPLWCDPDYASRTRYGELIAPPSFVFALSRILSGYVGGLPGVHAMWAGAELIWHRPIRLNTKVRTEAWLKDLVPHETEFSGLAIQQIYHVGFFDQHDEPLCEGDSWCFRTERDTAREKGTKYSKVRKRPPTRYTHEDLEEIGALYEREEVRGKTPRFFEDVRVGEKLPRMAKGPMTVTGIIAFAQGWGGLYIRANKLAWQQRCKHPSLGISNRFGIPDCPERVHWENEFAEAVGAPGAYDYGPERCSWLTHQLTNWMGDDGFLQQHRCEIRRHNPEGDTLFIEGEVARKFEREGLSCVEIAQRARNQQGELSAVGTGILHLPTRG